MLCECLHSFPELDPVLEEERRDSLLPTTVLLSPREGVKEEGEEGGLREEDMDKEEKEEIREEERKEQGAAENKEEEN